MYSRTIGETTYSFEPSGGLLHAGLVMQDRETDSYWSIMTETAISGDAKGQDLELLPGAVKRTFGDWRREHPGTRVLSIEGVEHDAREPYDRYFSSEEGFRGLQATDTRLPDKTPIFVFQLGETHHAIPQDSFVGGGVATFGGEQLFLHRRQDDSFYRSTAAWRAPVGHRFEHREGWQLVADGGDVVGRWDETTRRFETEVALEEFYDGFDTYWYIWSLTNPDGELTRASREAVGP